ncbi:MAG: ABC transporter ATP-binding protein [Deltaproteobacteria bacterium]
MDALLEFRNVTVFRGEKKALDRLDLTIHCDENTAILGPNGSGKSSLIRTITRENYPYAGGKKGPVFRIFGRDRWNTEELRGMLGVVGADAQQAVNVEETAFDTVLSGYFSSVGLFGRSPTAAMRNKADRTMGFLGIRHLKCRKMTEMSLGEARKVLIARALCHDPRALVLDEPTSGLDMKAASLFIRLLRKIAASGKNIIMVTHDVEDIFPEINRVIMLKAGRIYRDGPARKVLTKRNLRGLFDLPPHHRILQVPFAERSG